MCRSLSQAKCASNKRL